VPGEVTANWNSGVATSGLAGADLFTVGSVGQWFRLTEAFLVLAGFDLAATVTIRVFLTIAGAERMMPEDDWEPAFDGDLAYILWFWEIQIYGVLRIEVYSDQAADDGHTAEFEYRVKRW
jgi:hypothetical protein